MASTLKKRKKITEDKSQTISEIIETTKEPVKQKKSKKIIEKEPKKVLSRAYIVTQEQLAFTQKSLDIMKYQESEKAKKDLSGLMSYCNNCPHRTMQSIDAAAGYCDINHEKRVIENTCAKHVRGI